MPFPGDSDLSVNHWLKVSTAVWGKHCYQVQNHLDYKYLPLMVMSTNYVHLQSSIPVMEATRNRISIYMHKVEAVFLDYLQEFPWVLSYGMWAYHELQIMWTTLYNF